MAIPCWRERSSPRRHHPSLNPSTRLHLNNIDLSLTKTSSGLVSEPAHVHGGRAAGLLSGFAAPGGMCSVSPDAGDPSPGELSRAWTDAARRRAEAAAEVAPPRRSGPATITA
jgi:hypothetical protein